MTKLSRMGNTSGRNITSRGYRGKSEVDEVTGGQKKRWHDGKGMPSK